MDRTPLPGEAWADWHKRTHTAEALQSRGKAFSPFDGCKPRMSEREEAFRASPLAGLSDDEQRANARRWAKGNGFYGAQGGFIYNSQHKPVCQGWRAFFDRYRFVMLSSIDAGAFKVTRSRSK